MFTRCKASVCGYKSAAHVYRDHGFSPGYGPGMVLTHSLTMTTPCSLVNIATLQQCSICLCNSVLSSAHFPLVSDDEQVWAQNYRGRPRNKQFLRFCLLTWREDDATFAHENLPIFRPIWFFFGRYLMKALEDNQRWTFRPSIYFYYQVSPLQCSMVTQITS